ncbi:MAG: DUF4336 domain-containing protein [Phenylobacterium sp.]|nr:DUF4336 domain-containing protein [Phenylobacterium sp.]
MSTPLLEPFGPEIWLSAGPEVEVVGFRYPTRMVVIRLGGGGVLVISPVALTPGLKAAVEALGEVRHVVGPNSLHDLFLSEWRTAYPSARFHAAPGLRGQLPDLAFDADLTDTPPADWAGELEQVIVRGSRITQEVVFLHRASGTAIFTDLIQQFPRGWFKGWRALVARLDLMTEAEPAVPRKFRVAFSDRPAARASLRRILEWPTTKVLMAHGAPVERDGQAFLARAFRWLSP